MRVIAFDPGPALTGWAVADRRDGPATASQQVSWVAGGKMASAASDFESLLQEHPGAVVAIETPSGYVHDHARGAQLMKTAVVAGLIRGVAETRARRVVSLCASEWRRALVGNGRAKDGTIKRAVRVYVQGLPKRTSNHVRDALGLAVVALWNERAVSEPEALLPGWCRW